jgi:hypothetical protein
MDTYAQFKDRELRELRAEYPDADSETLNDMVNGINRRQKWVEAVTAAMREGTPNRQQWPHIVRELGPLYIFRRVFHDAPGSAERYLAAGLVLPPQPWGDE